MNSIDISIVAIYFALCLGFAFNKLSEIKTLEEYTLGNKRGFSLIVLVATIFATGISANTILGNIEKIHQTGLIYVIPMCFLPLYWLLTGLVFGKNAEQFRGCISNSDIMDNLYGKYARIIINICNIIKAIGMLSVQATAIGYLFKYFFDFDYKTGVLIGFGTLSLYSTIGGIKAVAITDVFQFCVFAVAFPIACGSALSDIGGVSGLLTSLPKEHLSIINNPEDVALVTCLVLYALVPTASAPYIQRLLIGRNSRQLLVAFSLVSILSLLFLAIIMLISFVMKIQSPEVSAKLVFYHFIANYLPHGLIGLMVSAMLAVIMSTADSWLNTTSSIIARDVIVPFFGNISSKREVNLARASSILISLIASIIAMKEYSIKNIVFFVANFWEPIVLFPLIAGFLGYRTKKITFYSSAITGVSTAVLSKFFVFGFYGPKTVISGIIGSGICFVITYLLVKNLEDNRKELA